MKSTRILVLAAAAAIVFDLIACLGDNNAIVYNVFMGLSCAAFCLYFAGLVYSGLLKERRTKVSAKSLEPLRKAA